MLQDYWRNLRRFSLNAWFFLSASALAGLGIGLFSPFFNLYLLRLGLLEDTVGQVTSVTTVGLGLFVIGGQVAIDRGAVL
ncbi:MAG: hypothetical protein HY871_08120 [Chloroflexi bacterium]|nr:hypothetical protein [Chloroflexota bacterium]